MPHSLFHIFYLLPLFHFITLTAETQIKNSTFLTQSAKFFCKHTKRQQNRFTFCCLFKIIILFFIISV